MRISREQALFEVAETYARRSTCTRKQVGAVIARRGRVLSIGYNGAPSGLPHCLDVGCLIDPTTGGCIRAIHAEQNAIAFAAYDGIRLEGGSMYTTVSPCGPCAKLIINSGVHHVFYLEEYRDTAPIDELRKAGIEVAKAPTPSMLDPNEI